MFSVALVLLGACGGGGPRHPAPVSARPTGTSPAVSASTPAFGLTEDNADLLSPGGGGAFQAARGEIAALHPTYLRLLVDWAALQPDPSRPPTLEMPVSGCARRIAPCGAYAGIRDELAAIAAQQRLAGSSGAGSSGVGSSGVGSSRPGAPGAFQVVIDIFGVPAWAARAPSGCERAGTAPFSRPLAASAVDSYRALIRSLLALASREGVALPWWSPWNEPNDPVFVSPQRASCASGSPPLSAAVYAQLARAMAAELHVDGGGPHQLLLGELAGSLSDSPHRTSITAFVAALPADVLCLSEVWSVHAYARRDLLTASPVDPVRSLEDGARRTRRVLRQRADLGHGGGHRRSPPGQAKTRRRG